MSEPIEVTQARVVVTKLGFGGTLHGRPTALWSDQRDAKVDAVPMVDGVGAVVSLSLVLRGGNDDGYAEIRMNRAETAALIQRLRSALGTYQSAEYPG